MVNPYSRQLANLEVDPNEVGLIGAWDMWLVNGGVPDATGVNDGTVVGSLHGEYQSLGRSLRYNGSSYLNIGNDSSLQISSGSVTLSFWCRFNDITGFHGLISKGNAISDQNYHLRSNNNALNFYFRNSANTANIVAATVTNPLFINQLYHIVFTHTFGDNTTTRFYVNGDSLAVNWTGGTGDELPLVNTVDDATIGNRGVPDSYFDGNIFAAKFFNVYKDQAWVTQEYNRGKSSLWSTKYGADISAAAIAGGHLENTPFRVLSGSHKIASYSINGLAAKAIECVAAGNIEIVSGHYHPDNNDTAFGDYECWIEKASGHTTQLGFINQGRNNTSNGYGFQILTDGTTTIEEWGVGSIVTGGSLTPGTLAKLNLKRRSYDGRFEGFIDGASFGTGTDTTIVKSYYSVFSLGIGDKIVYVDRNNGHAIVKRLVA